MADHFPVQYTILTSLVSTQLHRKQCAKVIRKRMSTTLYSHVLTRLSDRNQCRVNEGLTAPHDLKPGSVSSGSSALITVLRCSTKIPTSRARSHLMLVATTHSSVYTHWSVFRTLLLNTSNNWKFHEEMTIHGHPSLMTDQCPAFIY